MIYFKKISGIHSLLVSGNDEQLFSFNLITCYFLNAIDRRGQTVRYTCPSEYFDAAIETAKATGVTLQEIHYFGDKEVYPFVVKNEHAGWVLK